MINREYDIKMSVTLDELKQHLRMTSADFDGDLLLKLKAAISASESFVGIVLSKSIYTLSIPFAPKIEIKQYPLNSITEVKVDAVEINKDKYHLDDSCLVLDSSLIGLKIEVKYDAGMSTIADDIRAAILLKAGSLFNNPIDSVDQLPKASTSLLRPHRRWEIR